MTKEEISKLEIMQIDGCKPKEIAVALNKTISTITSYIRRHPAPTGTTLCRQCGSIILLSPGRKVSV